MYGIQQRRHYYTGTLNVIEGWHWIGLYHDQPDEYRSIAAARERIREMETSTHETAHGEYARPDYRVRNIKSRRTGWIQVRVTIAESDDISTLAAESGKTVSEYVRDRALRKPVK